MSRHLLPLLAVGLALGSAPAALAQRADLDVGPHIGGQNWFIDLRTSEPSSPFLLFIGADGTPTPAPGAFLPSFCMNINAAVFLFATTDANGRFFVDAPTTSGAWGPVGTGAVLYYQVLMQPGTGGLKIASTRAAAEIEPTAVLPGFLVDQAAANLPSYYDDIDGIGAHWADIDRDGDKDVVVTGLTNNDTDFFLALWENDGSCRFTDVTSTRIPSFPQGQSVGVVEFFDANGDNMPDLFVGGGPNSGGPNIDDSLWINNGFTFTEDTTFPNGQGFVVDVATGDFDKDGRVDMALANGTGAHTPVVLGLDQVYLNTTSGWSVTTPVPGPCNDTSVGSTGISTADFDNDGNLDLFIARTDAANCLFQGSGLGSFSDASTVLSFNPADNSQDATWADFTNNGSLDLLVSNSHLSVPAASSGDYFLNDGLGGAGSLAEDSSSEIETYLPTDGFRLQVRARDLDADGDTDVFFGAHDLFAGANHQVYLNDDGVQGGTAGDLKRQFWFDPDDYISGALDCFDCDNDGDDDVLQLAGGVVTGSTTQQFRTRLFVNSNL